MHAFTDMILFLGKRITDFFKRDKQAKQTLQPELVLESGGYRFTNAKVRSLTSLFIFHLG